MRQDSSATKSGWFKSSFSSPSQSCVEVRFDGDLVHIRDTKDNGLGPVITVDVDQWTLFLAGLTSAGPVGGALAVDREPNGAVRIRALSDGTSLTYTRREWQMFLRGVEAQEFRHPATTAQAI